MTGGIKLKYLGWLGALVYNVRPPVSDHRSEIILESKCCVAELHLSYTNKPKVARGH
jgi:hypothetical protein